MDNEGLGLRLSPFKSMLYKWFLKGLSDSDWAGDKDSRKSITGYIIYFMGVPISWKSKQQQSVALSSTEAEYYALSEIVVEIKGIVNVLNFMNIQVSYPIEVYVDNFGAICLSKNARSTNRTKHIDTRAHFVRNYQEDGKVIIKFIKSADNDADIMTKNVTGEIYDNHAAKLVCMKEDI